MKIFKDKEGICSVTLNRFIDVMDYCNKNKNSITYQFLVIKQAPNNL